MQALFKKPMRKRAVKVGSGQMFVPGLSMTLAKWGITQKKGVMTPSLKGHAEVADSPGKVRVGMGELVQRSFRSDSVTKPCHVLRPRS